MSAAAWKNELKDFLLHNPKDCRVVVLPDLFLDRLINLNWDFTEFSQLVKAITKRKGGSIDGITQTDLSGGNAINVASALASLGASVTPIVCTSQYGLQQIKYYFKENAIDTSKIKLREKASVTTALEFENNNEKINVMIRDLGSLKSFGPNDLDDSDYALIDSADYTCVFNWAGTLKFGTALAQAVFARVKAKGKGKTYCDTADPTPNISKVAELMENVLKSNKMDILSLNENEAIVYASLIDDSINYKKIDLPFSELSMDAARILARNLTTRIDLHTTAFSASLKDKREVIVPSFKIKALRATGAGDAWDAGNILGDRNDLSDECRLMFANAVSACYLSDPEGKHPSWNELSIFIKNNA